MTDDGKDMTWAEATERTGHDTLRHLVLDYQKLQELLEKANAKLARVQELERKNETLRNAWQTSEADRAQTVKRAEKLEREVARLKDAARAAMEMIHPPTAAAQCHVGICTVEQCARCQRAARVFAAADLLT